MDIRGKRLLILGGQQKMCDLVLRARELGVYTVVTDWYPDSPAKRIADKALDISISDMDRLQALVREEKIDGVITGFIDSYLPHYMELCRRTGLPCYLNQTTLACSTDKQRFKQLCRQVGLRTIPEVDLSRPEEISFPVVVKPVDNSGSKGITVCSSAQMLRPAQERALRFSKSKRILTERFMNCDYVAAHYIVTDGRPELVTLMDKDMNRIGRGKTPYPTAFVSPSRYSGAYLQYAHPLVLRLVRQIGLQNGTFLISFFVDNNTYYAVEMAARLTATRVYILSGIDAPGMYIRYALTGKAGEVERKKRGQNSMIYCMLMLFVKEGIIGKIEGLEKIRSMSGVLNVLQSQTVGAKIRADGSYGQSFARIYLAAKDAGEMIEKVEFVQKTLSVTGTDGRPLLIAGFDARSFFQN